jgi:FtsP/CotA-like multicopper oxidase with cupredoxin domain
VNGQFPGPLVWANKGDTLVIEVQNNMHDPTSIHWHGMYQRGTPHMDGSRGITQCDIEPGASFTYQFSVPDQAGTYWYVLCTRERQPTDHNIQG